MSHGEGWLIGGCAGHSPLLMVVSLRKLDSRAVCASMALRRFPMSVLIPYTAPKKISLPAVEEAGCKGGGAGRGAVTRTSVCWALVVEEEACVSLCLLVPLTCMYLQDSTRHICFLNEFLQIVGWNMPQLLPSLHPFFPFMPWFMSLLHGLGCLNLHS